MIDDNTWNLIAAFALFIIVTVLGTVLRGLDRRQRRPPDVVAKFIQAETHYLTIEGELEAMQLKEGQRVAIAVALLTARGNLAAYEPGSASFTSSDPSVASVTQNTDNPLEAFVDALDGSENESVLIEFRADGKVGEGVRDIVATLPVTVTQGDAFVAEIRANDPFDYTPADEPATPEPAEPGPATEEPETGNGSGSPLDPSTGSTPTEPTTGSADLGSTDNGSDTGSTDAGNVPPADGSDTPPATETGTGETGTTPTPTDDGPATSEPALPEEPTPDRADTPDLHPTPENPVDSEGDPDAPSKAPTQPITEPHDQPAKDPLADVKPLTDERSDS